jgi:glucan 1,3-beta-glucosidase
VTLAPLDSVEPKPLTSLQYTSGNGPQNQYGTNVNTPRPSGLLDANGDYVTMAPPTYSQYSSNQFVNIKNVAGMPVYGDGVTDDTANINAILQQYAGCNII